MWFCTQLALPPRHGQSGMATMTSLSWPCPLSLSHTVMCPRDLISGSNMLLCAWSRHTLTGQSGRSYLIVNSARRGSERLHVYEDY